MQPWLGTFVKVGVCGLPIAEAHHAIDAAFRVTAQVHQRMSFYATDSDVSRLNRAAQGQKVQVHADTFAVLQEAFALSARTSGIFDVTVGAELARWKLLPSQAEVENANTGSWEDCELLPGHVVRLRRRVCIDLGGIAKGFAVDRAVESLRTHGAKRVWVNAGGDIRVSGRGGERILLDAEESKDGCVTLELEEGSLASSLSQRAAYNKDVLHGPHVDGRTRSPAAIGRFVSVFHERCMLADALTKVVMVLGPESAPLLRSYRASALMHDREGSWSGLEMEAFAQ